MTPTRRSRLVLLLSLLAATAVGLPVLAASQAPRAAPGTYLTLSPIDVVANDVLYDAGRDVVYASVPSTGGPQGNSIVRISPTGEVGKPIFVGSEPNALALSTDGRYLYVGIDGAAAYRRVDLTNDSVGPLWPLGRNSCGSFRAVDMVVLADDPHALAVARRNIQCDPNDEGIAVYDDGVMRPETTLPEAGTLAIEPSGDPNVLYGIAQPYLGDGLQIFALSPDGITETQNEPGLLSSYAYDFHYQDGRIYDFDGRVIDEATLTLLGTYSSHGPLVVDSDAGEIVFATGDEFTTRPALQAFELDTFLPRFGASIPSSNGYFTPADLLVTSDGYILREKYGRVARLQLITGWAVSGRVTDEYGYGLGGVEISDGAGNTTLTDNDGQYQLAPLPDGTHTLAAALDGRTFDPPSREVTVPPDMTGQDFEALPPQAVWGLCLPVVQR